MIPLICKVLGLSEMVSAILSKAISLMNPVNTELRFLSSIDASLHVIVAILLFAYGEYSEARNG